MSHQKKSILHIASDEKFINAANLIFEKAFPGSNKFLIPLSRFQKEMKYVDPKPNVDRINKSSHTVGHLAKQTLNYDCIFLHGFTELNCEVYLASPVKDKIIGLLWGAELYVDRYLPGYPLTGDLTSALNLKEPRKSFKEQLKDLIRKVVYKKIETVADSPKLAAATISYLATLYREECDFFKEKKILSEECKFFPFCYYPLEYINQGNEKATIKGNDILLGNSASDTNNHLEAFVMLKNIGIGNRKLVVPLSYGSKVYADYVQKIGDETFNGNFNPLRTFMPLEDYNRILQSCGVVVMNHYRQQAVGNIVMMLWLGSKVYLNESSTFYCYLKRIGIIVFSIDKDFRIENPEVLDNLQFDDVHHNRQVLKKTIGLQQIVDNLREGMSEYFK
ncbi:TDP-N-acetylfucosamine:lipid II N-acetylfucosaminyltransferase [Saccharicrinis sp. GN24d3]|uniref:TDP-N-acetylfucosamine:lipid II N-acetylfucosaminyltransferase n=1 Tax=Saccharicrinis sp. GN24d3 TaxID=3458416 RepID=UPI00403530EE